MSDTAPSRVFLVVVDETPEHRIAVRYAARRASHTGGRVAMLYVTEPAELQHFQAIEELARTERREAAEELLHTLCDEVAPVAGSMPIVYIREGRARDELLQLINEDPANSVLVLAAGTGPEGPGPLITYLTTGRLAARLRIPITIVPGGLSMDQVDQLS
ncbi:MAG: universal stress protein [Alphaproteobacteria bacterium]